MATPIRIDETLLSRLCPARPETGHKGTFGRLLIYAGSTGMGGAAVMAAGSALRSGTGLVYVLTSQDVLTPLLIRCPEALGIPLPQEKTSSPLVPMAGGLSRLMPAVPAEKESWFSKIISDKQAVLMGPGLQPDRQDVLSNLPFALENAPHLVLDAGALTVLSAHPEKLSLLTSRREKGLSPVVLTPHLGEFKRLLPSWEEGDYASASAFAVEYGVVLVLKSNETNLFTSSGKWYSNPVRNSGLAKGGSGDILAGLLSGLLSQGMSEEDAAVSAVGIHSLAGKLCREKLGARAMLPTDLWTYFGACFQRLQWEEGITS